MDSSDISEIKSKSCIDLDSNQIKLTADDFEFGKYLGEGGYAKVYHARKRTGRDQGTIVAMKVYIYMYCGFVLVRHYYYLGSFCYCFGLCPQVIRKLKIIENQKRIDNIGFERRMLADIEVFNVD